MDSAQKPLLIPDRWDSRTMTMIGEDALRRLRDSHVLVAGVGGVGGYAAEMLARSGIGKITLIDSDDVDITNINRQIIALHSTVGKPKTELFVKRFLDINPAIEVKSVHEFISPQNIEEIIGHGYDYVIDAIDTVSPKLSLICESIRRKIPIISSMGAGGRWDPSKVGYSDIWHTSEDGLARAVRQGLKKRGIRYPLRVVCSSEAPGHKSLINLDLPNKKSSFGTLPTIPALFGIFLASEVIKKLITK